MLNDLLSSTITFFDNLLTDTGVFTKLSGLFNYLDDYQDYLSEFNKYLSGVYYIFGKSLVIYMVTAFGVIVGLKVLFVVLNVFKKKG